MLMVRQDGIRQELYFLETETTRGSQMHFLLSGVQTRAFGSLYRRAKELGSTSRRLLQYIYPQLPYQKSVPGHARRDGQKVNWDTLWAVKGAIETGRVTTGVVRFIVHKSRKTDSKAVIVIFLCFEGSDILILSFVDDLIVIGKPGTLQSVEIELIFDSFRNG